MLHLVERLNALDVVLASSSPRRRDILDMIGMNVRVVPSAFDEGQLKSRRTGMFASPEEYVRASAYLKAAHAVGACPTADVIIAADTIVVVDGDILEKPIDDAHAASMLERLSGRTHRVLTGVSIVTRNAAAADKGDAYVDNFALLLPNGFNPGTHHHRTWVSATAVDVVPLDRRLIDAYIATGEHRDKAGSYGIQGCASVFIKGIHGCFYNVMGFPLQAFSTAMQELFDSIQPK
ncbi:Septum formation protein Maf [Plasmodiophora brassicae]|uniref:Septum formation protein Maf n=1 Tax=Plasmodiophora brassicae TaxID=37360 RepID=A0A0G4IIF2_PLABS|nr:hypothetical protein PBRA_003757 [Plasmodiophora brassicae]SPQ94275.1 unnamed protein product [Plasmodiophora brassicae]